MNSGSPLPPGSVAFPVAGGASGYSAGYPVHPSSAVGYPSTPYSSYVPPGQPTYPTGLSSHSRNPSGAYADISRQFKDMDLGSKEDIERDRKTSGEFSHPRKHSASDKTYERTRTTSGNYSDRPMPYPSPPETFVIPRPYGNAAHGSGRPNPYPASHYSSASTNLHDSDMSSFGTANSTGYPGPNYASSSSPVHSSTDHIARSTIPFSSPSAPLYSRSHNLDGQSLVSDNNSRSRAPSRAGSPNLGIVLTLDYSFSKLIISSFL